MKNLLLGVLFFSTASLAQNTKGVEVPETVVDSLVGSVDDYNIRNGDDRLDFGLVIPSLTKAQVMDFNLSYVLSSETAVIRAAGQKINVPSNLSLPKQNERYSFFTIRVDKPEFKLPLTSQGLPSEVVALEGRFPFTSTVDNLRAGKPLFTVINSFSFKSYSVSPLDVNAPDAPLALSVGQRAINGAQVEFISPLAEDTDFVTLGLNLASSIGEDSTIRHFPIDIKTLEQPEFLKTDLASNTTPLVVSIPKAVFESAEDASTKPFPFTMVWGEAAPAVSLPLAKTFVSFRSENTEADQIDIDFTKITNVDVIGIEATFVDAEGGEVQNTFEIGNFKELVIIVIPEGAARARVDIYAIDSDPILASIIVENALTEDDILKEAKYITRYEEDLY